jgi:hypothetical protein
MVVRVINEIERPLEPARRGRFGRGVRRVTGKNAVLFALTLGLSGAIFYILLQEYPKRQVPVLVNTAVEPALQRIDARVDETLAQIGQIDQDVRTRLQTIGDNTGGRPETDRAAPPEARPWVLHADGLQPINSRDPDMSKATEIHIATGLSDNQIKAVATEVNTQVGPRLNALADTMGSHLDEKVEELTAQNKLTEAQLASLKADLVQSVKGVLEEERVRNQQLWQQNVVYRDLFHKSLELNQDLIALYAGKARDDHALGNAIKVIPQLFTLKVWQNKDDKSLYTQLLSRYQDITSESQRVSDVPGQP